MATHTFQSLDLALSEFLEHVRARALVPRIVVVRGLVAKKHHATQQVVVSATSTPLIQYNPTTGLVELRQDPGEQVYEAAVDTVEACARPSCNALAHIFSGNSYICATTKAKVKASRDASPKHDLDDVELRVHEVRTITMRVILPGLDGDSVVLEAGTILDVGNAVNVPGFVVLRTTRQTRHAIAVQRSLDWFSSLVVDETDVGPIREDEEDCTTELEQVQQLHVVCRDVYACGPRGIKIPLRKGEKALLYMKGSYVAWLKDTKGRRVVMAMSTVASHLLDMKVEEFVTSRPSKEHSRLVLSSQTSELPWKAHTLNCDQTWPGDNPVFAAGQQHPTIRQAAFACPRGIAGLPLPLPNWQPPEGRLRNGLNPLGYWDFASDDDQGMALSMSLTSAARTIFAAANGQRGLGNIGMKWIPGDLEGSQGVGFEVCSAYVHIYMINFRRSWVFGLSQVPLDELPVYTGTDPFWHEARGANANLLDSLKSPMAPPPSPTEDILFHQARARQGYAAKQLPAPAANLAPNVTGAAQQWQNALLIASHRSIGLGHRLASEHPIDPSRSLKMRTSFHPYLADCGYHIKMPDSNYLLLDLQAVKASVFRRGKKSLSVVDADLPLLNADGEGMSTILMSQTTRVVEVQLTDYPCLPRWIAADEDFSLLESFHRMTRDWLQIGARMDECERYYTNAINSEAWKIRHTYRMIDKAVLTEGESLNKAEKAHFLASVAARPITNAHQAQNTLRGCAPGKLDPALAKTAIVWDVAGNQVPNWVEYPLCDSNPTLRLRRQHELVERKNRSIREELIKKQSEARRDSTQRRNDSEGGEEEGPENETADTRRNDLDAATSALASEDTTLEEKDPRMFGGKLHACVICQETGAHKPDCIFAPPSS